MRISNVMMGKKMIQEFLSLPKVEVPWDDSKVLDCLEKLGSGDVDRSSTSAVIEFMDFHSLGVVGGIIVRTRRN